MLFALVLLFACVFATDIETEFTKWVNNNDKVYVNDQEYQYRLAVFASNLDSIQQLNEEGGAQFGINKFADLTSAEFRAIYLGSIPPLDTNEEKELLELPQVTAPDTFSWVPTGKLTPVKNQAQCGSCWAFSATENIESVWMIAKNITSDDFKPLAPQQIVDCDKTDGGCNGGWPRKAMQYVISAGGQDTEASYPYKAVNQACHFIPASVETKITSWKYITQSKSEDDMKTAVATVSPLSICVDASKWQFYSGGIMTSTQCGGTSLDHCVQLVGYDTSSAASPYWNVRNSWGANWGEKGFIRLQYGHDTCGCAQEVTTAVA